MAKVLITGGTGLIGQQISKLLISEGHQINILSRSKTDKQGDIRYFKWDLNTAFIEEGALDVDHIIHLAGAGVVDKRWTKTRKQEIIDSRVQSTQLLIDTITDRRIKSIQSIACASAVGYYGSRGNEVLKEDAKPGEGYLTDVCVLWENSSKRFQKELNIPTAMIRVGIVLSTNGGALPQLAAPIKFGIGAYLGNGQQYYPWIHIEDISRAFIYAIKNKLSGIYNGTAPTPETNKGIAKMVAKVINRPFIPAPAPKFVLKVMMGEMADMLLNSQRTQSDKIVEVGFEFKFPDLEMALVDIYSRGV